MATKFETQECTRCGGSGRYSFNLLAEGDSTTINQQNIVNPDQTTVDYLRGRPFAPKGAAFDKAAEWWLSLASEKDSPFDDKVVIDGSKISPTVTWGINPAQSVNIEEAIPAVSAFPKDEQKGIQEALQYHFLRKRIEQIQSQAA